MSGTSEIKLILEEGAKIITSEATSCQIRENLTNSENKAYLEDLLDLNVPPEFSVKGKSKLLIDSITPVNSVVQGVFKQSTAYYNMTEWIPIILTKLIDYLARESDTIRVNYGASEEEIKIAIQYITKLKNEVTTNKAFTLLKEKSLETEKWNEYIRNAESPQYYTSISIFSECYIYRRLREPFALSRTMQNFDLFGNRKEEAFNKNIEQMCLVTNRLSEMVTETHRDKRRQNFILLLKLCLWANNQDPTLIMGSAVSDLAADPIRLASQLNKQILVDDSANAVDAICSRREKLITNEKNDGANGVESNEVIFDIVCDDAGYEFFTDLCLAYFLIHMKIVDRVRLHVKQIPWFIFNTTPKDVQNIINSCKTANFTKELNTPSSKETENEIKKFKSTQQHLTSRQLNAFGSKCEEYIKDGTILIQSDDYWTSPCLYKDMKTIDPRLYEKLRLSTAILFKGDLNYRKLIGEKNWIPTTAFDTALQGFHPALVIAARTVKCDIICGLTPATVEKTTRFDPKWMETGKFGVIQFSAKCDTRHQEQ